LNDKGFAGPGMGSNYGIGFDCANNDKYAISFKSYMIDMYMHMEKMVQWFQKCNESDWKEESITLEEYKQSHMKMCELWIEKDKIMYKDWALKMQGFDLDEWMAENKEWIDSIK